MLVIEILNDKTHPANSRMGSYDYVVKVNKRVIATGYIEKHDRSKHWSVLAAKVAEDGKRRELESLIGSSLSRFLTERLSTEGNSKCQKS